MQLFEKPTGHREPVTPDTPEQALVNRIADDWKSVAHGGTTIELARDLSALAERDNAVDPTEVTYSRHIGEINQRLSNDLLLPNLNLVGARDGQVIVGDQARQKAGVLTPGQGMLEVLDLDDKEFQRGQIVGKTPDRTSGLVDGPVTTDGIRQTVVPDCKWQAHLASFADADPLAVKRMIKDNQDGTYTVTFPGDKDHPQRVGAPTDWEKATFSNPDFQGNQWALILDKAFRQRSGEPFGPYKPAEGFEGLLTGKRNATLVYLPDFKDVPAIVTGSDWIRTKLGFEPLIPANASTESLSKQLAENSHEYITQQRDQLPAQLNEALGKHMIVTTGFAPESLGGSKQIGADPGAHQLDIENQHAYAVTNYDENHGLVTLRNPWRLNLQTNTGESADDKRRIPGGNVVMGIEEFKRSTAFLNVEPTSRSEM
ncbi:MAG: hypothetical protein JSS86_05725 [Cyanobacteria bacterium SZAS LIN-2]|nr:hypothetical protein [Cyanobacteria bacterium SZAS LIN-3]MBS1995786.1 hypothetical protein [Cyanobacteria bacterium SZAS LIN-2]MBS2009404.1 hypothetical protein [Cyanobacteria bacterium SZAS TMP-1]